MSIEAHKKRLRGNCLQTRNSLPSADLAFASSRVCARILALEHYHQAKHIALYRAIHGEIDLNELAALPEQIRYFPVMNPDHTLSFLPVTPDTLFLNNRFGIPEPDVKRELAVLPEQLDIIFLPVVAFDEYGTRLGMGGGYYDKTLAQSRSSLLIGVAYEFQRQPFIEREAWDVPLNAVITPETTYWSEP